MAISLRVLRWTSYQRPVSDCFTIPISNTQRPSATSVDVERAFSKGTLTVSKYRHSLSYASTMAAIVLSAWLQVGGIVVEKDVIDVLEEKARRRKVAKEAAGTSQEDGIVIE